jgi:hypothetical protein
MLRIVHVKTSQASDTAHLDAAHATINVLSAWWRRQIVVPLNLRLSSTAIEAAPPRPPPKCAKLVVRVP